MLKMKEIDIHKPIEWGHQPLCFKLKPGNYVLVRPMIPTKPLDVARVVDIKGKQDGSETSVLLEWFRRPEDCPGGRSLFHGAKEIIFVPTDSRIRLSTDRIEGKCKVHSLDTYTKLDSVGNDDFFCRFEYNPNNDSFNPAIDSLQVYCKCKLPYNPDFWMVECEDCENKFHPHCIGLTIEKVRAFQNGDEFCCQECSNPHNSN